MLMHPQDQPLMFSAERRHIRYIRGFQNPPVLNQWYNLFDYTGGVTIDTAYMFQTNGGAAVQNVEVRLIIDDTTFNTVFAPLGHAVNRSIAIGGENFNGVFIGNPFDGCILPFVVYRIYNVVPALSNWTGHPLSCNRMRLDYRMTTIGLAQQITVIANIQTVQ